MRAPLLAASRLKCTITPYRLNGRWSGNMRTVYLDELEMEALGAPDLDAEAGSSWPDFLVRLLEKVDRSTGCLHLDTLDLEQIPRFAFDYGQEAWQARLVAVFGRALGPQLGR